MKNQYRARAKWLADMVPNGGLILEVGVHVAKTAVAMLEERSDIRYIGIDFYRPYQTNATRFWGDVQRRLASAHEALGPYVDRASLVVARSDVVGSMATIRADVVHIDAGHYYDDVRTDLRVWGDSAPIITGHDWGDEENPAYGEESHKGWGVKRAVLEWLPEGCEVVLGPDFSWMVRRE